MIADNLANVKRRIASACEKAGRPQTEVKLICVTKEAPVDKIAEAISLGVTALGENRVKDAQAKQRAIGTGVEWHLIGHLQTNKVKQAAGIFSLIHSVDSLRLAAQIDKEAGKAGKVQSILIQVNVSGEESKFGMPAVEIEKFLDHASSCQNIRIDGLMTIAPEVDNPEKVRRFFRALRELRDALQKTRNTVKELSMGMTNDFEIAVEEGATMVRVGRAIFGRQVGR
jgi:pyridoxal phosphate enzyme (YggS family)